MSVGNSRELKGVPVRSLKICRQFGQKNIAEPGLVFLARSLMLVAAQEGQFIGQCSSFRQNGAISIPEMRPLDLSAKMVFEF